jgi:hypothetical protein
MTIRTSTRMRFLRFLLLVFLSAAVGGGCSAFNSGGVAAGSGSEVWKLGDQFVRLAPQDGEAPTLPNDQPAALTPEELRHMLGALEVKFPDKKEDVPVFSELELKILGKAISTGLAEAGPHQDVTFAIVGMHPGSFTLERRLTTGRVFVRNGKLNLIFGNLQSVFDENQDRRLHPFQVGSRHSTTPPPWRIKKMPGVAYFVQGKTPRPNWLLLDPSRKEWPVAELGNQKKVSSALKAAEDTRAETEALKAQQKKLQEEVLGIQKDLAEGRKAEAAPMKDQGNIRARLKLLKQLRQENLITEKEYQEKKQQILNEL